MLNNTIVECVSQKTLDSDVTSSGPFLNPGYYEESQPFEEPPKPTASSTVKESKNQRKIEKTSTIEIREECTTAIDLPPISWHGYGVAPKCLNAVNTGETVTIKGQWSNGRPYIKGGPLNGTYMFSQIHFHSPSEHEVDGTRYPLEMHVLHYKTSYLTQERAVNEKDGTVVLVYLFQVVGNETVLSNITKLCPEIRELNSRAEATDLPLDEIIKPFTANYYVYWGKLTTEKSSYIIQWIINCNVLQVSEREVQDLLSIMNSSDVRKDKLRMQPENNTIFYVGEDYGLPLTETPTDTFSFICTSCDQQSSFSDRNIPEDSDDYRNTCAHGHKIPEPHTDLFPSEILFSLSRKVRSRRGCIGSYPVSWWKNVYAKSSERLKRRKKSSKASIREKEKHRKDKSVEEKIAIDCDGHLLKSTGSKSTCVEGQVLEFQISDGVCQPEFGSYASPEICQETLAQTYTATHLSPWNFPPLPPCTASPVQTCDHPPSIPPPLKTSPAKSSPPPPSSPPTLSTTSPPPTGPPTPPRTKRPGLPPCKPSTPPRKKPPTPPHTRPPTPPHCKHTTQADSKSSAPPYAKPSTPPHTRSSSTPPQGKKTTPPHTRPPTPPHCKHSNHSSKSSTPPNSKPSTPPHSQHQATSPSPPPPSSSSQSSKVHIAEERKTTKDHKDKKKGHDPKAAKEKKEMKGKKSESDSSVSKYSGDSETKSHKGKDKKKTKEKKVKKNKSKSGSEDECTETLDKKPSKEKKKDKKGDKKKNKSGSEDECTETLDKRPSKEKKKDKKAEKKKSKTGSEDECTATLDKKPSKEKKKDKKRDKKKNKSGSEDECTETLDKKPSKEKKKDKKAEKKKSKTGSEDECTETLDAKPSKEKKEKKLERKKSKTGSEHSEDECIEIHDAKPTKEKKEKKKKEKKEKKKGKKGGKSDSEEDFVTDDECYEFQETHPPEEKKKKEKKKGREVGMSESEEDFVTDDECYEYQEVESPCDTLAKSRASKSEIEDFHTDDECCEYQEAEPPCEMLEGSKDSSSGSEDFDTEDECYESQETGPPKGKKNEKKKKEKKKEKKQKKDKKEKKQKKEKKEKKGKIEKKKVKEKGSVSDSEEYLDTEDDYEEECEEEYREECEEEYECDCEEEYEKTECEPEICCEESFSAGLPDPCADAIIDPVDDSLPDVCEEKQVDCSRRQSNKRVKFTKVQNAQKKAEDLECNGDVKTIFEKKKDSRTSDPCDKDPTLPDFCNPHPTVSYLFSPSFVIDSVPDLSREYNAESPVSLEKCFDVLNLPVNNSIGSKVKKSVVKSKMKGPKKQYFLQLEQVFCSNEKGDFSSCNRQEYNLAVTFNKTLLQEYNGIFHPNKLEVGAYEKVDLIPKFPDPKKLSIRVQDCFAKMESLDHLYLRTKFIVEDLNIVDTSTYAEDYILNSLEKNQKKVYNAETQCGYKDFNNSGSEAKNLQTINDKFSEMIAEKCLEIVNDFKNTKDGFSETETEKNGKVSKDQKSDVCRRKYLESVINRESGLLSKGYLDNIKDLGCVSEKSEKERKKDLDNLKNEVSEKLREKLSESGKDKVLENREKSSETFSEKSSDSISRKSSETSKGKDFETIKMPPDSKYINQRRLEGIKPNSLCLNNSPVASFYLNSNDLMWKGKKFDKSEMTKIREVESKPSQGFESLKRNSRRLPADLPRQTFRDEKERFGGSIFGSNSKAAKGFLNGQKKSIYFMYDKVEKDETSGKRVLVGSFRTKEEVLTKGKKNQNLDNSDSVEKSGNNNTEPKKVFLLSKKGSKAEDLTSIDNTVEEDIKTKLKNQPDNPKDVVVLHKYKPRHSENKNERLNLMIGKTVNELHKDSKNFKRLTEIIGADKSKNAKISVYELEEATKDDSPKSSEKEQDSKKPLAWKNLRSIDSLKGEKQKKARVEIALPEGIESTKKESHTALIIIPVDVESLSKIEVILVEHSENQKQGVEKKQGVESPSFICS